MKVCISTHARFGGKSHSFPYREAFDLILMSTLTWITHGEIARGRDKKKETNFFGAEEKIRQIADAEENAG